MAADEPESPAWQHGGIKVVVALLDAGVAATKSAAMTMERLSFENDTNQDAIREAGGIAPLVALLGAGSDSEAAGDAAGALRNLSENATNKDAIREAGGIAPLVALLGAGADSGAARDAAGALMNLAVNATNKDAIREAGGIAPLVALLGAGADSDAARCAAGALRNLAFSIFNEDAILGGVACAGVSTAFHTPLHRKLQEISTSRLIAAEAGDNVTALERAIRHANALSLPAATIQRASERLAEINGEAALQARRASLGLGALPLPDEFVCPITCEKMKDPVVASDGNSYERSAIATVPCDPPPPALL